MTALRFQAGGRHQTLPASLHGRKRQKLMIYHERTRQNLHPYTPPPFQTTTTTKTGPSSSITAEEQEQVTSFSIHSATLPWDQRERGGMRWGLVRISTSRHCQGRKLRSSRAQAQNTHHTGARTCRCKMRQTDQFSQGGLRWKCSSLPQATETRKWPTVSQHGA